MQLADQIVARTARTGVHSSGRWQRAADDPRVDASLLLPAIRGAVTADDPRSLATLAAVGSELAEAGHAYRFRHDERPLGEAGARFSSAASGFRSPTGGSVVRRRRSGGSNERGLRLDRQVSTRRSTTWAQRQLRGNIPQAFVHALLLECAAGQPG